MRNRSCTNPPAQNGGKTCLDQGLGPELETQLCNVQPCPSKFVQQTSVVQKMDTNIQQINHYLLVIVGLLFQQQPVYHNPFGIKPKTWVFFVP